ncbi:S-layer homology domain-containing protein [Sporosarcina sp. GW1-11]|uniref:S-layer homology domain-containing protein n=1 Tax=Sporosarcina sp. GW1-11 TaxID=2899126 RepID=UPI00294EEC1D|nr:S-layer homology domain-containing protein [Sporosarcina sp. GW1-11]MDV6378883.1 S-layer homology domain-containing protein [Sporosarcina sp. GW1-11]
MKAFRLMVCTILLLVMSLVYVSSTEATAMEFKDVSKKHSNYAAIQEMQKAGFISGYPDGTFRPSEKISRKHVAALLDKALKLPHPSESKVVFNDVPKSHPYYVPIMKLANAGIVSGGLDGNFNPEAAITRVQMAKVLDLAFDFNMTDYSGFHDILVTHWGYVHANALFSNDVAKGNQGFFLPNHPVTRAHYAEFLNRSIHMKTPQPGTDKFKKEAALDKFNRLNSQIERVLLLGEENNKTFNQIRSDLLPYATPAFADGFLKEVYQAVSPDYDDYLLYPLITEVQVRFEFQQPDANTLTIQTAQFRNRQIVGGFIDAVIKQTSGQWKLADYYNTSVGKKNLSLTIDEAKFIVKEDYRRNGYGDVDVTYVSKTQLMGEDYSTHEKYPFDQYKFIVEGMNGRDTITFHADSGFF